MFSKRRQKVSICRKGLRFNNYHFRVMEGPSASQQFNRKDMKLDASGTNRSYDIKIDNFDIAFGDK